MFWGYQIYCVCPLVPYNLRVELNMLVNYRKCHMQKTYQRQQMKRVHSGALWGKNMGYSVGWSREGEGRYETEGRGEKQVVERSVEATWFAEVIISTPACDWEWWGVMYGTAASERKTSEGTEKQFNIRCVLGVISVPSNPKKRLNWMDIIFSMDKLQIMYFNWSYINDDHALMILLIFQFALF